MHMCPGNWVTIERAVVYYVQAAHASSAGIKCRHCIHLSFVIWYQSRSFETAILACSTCTLNRVSFFRVKYGLVDPNYTCIVGTSLIYHKILKGDHY